MTPNIKKCRFKSKTPIQNVISIANRVYSKRTHVARKSRRRVEHSKKKKK